MLLKHILVFLTIYQITKAAKPCQTPNGQYGEYKFLQDCQSLNQHMIGHTSPKMIEFIRRSHCGFEKNQPKVCCPLAVKPQLNQTEKFLSSSLLPENCGYGTENKIVGGEVTDLDEFPWMALLDYEDEFGSRSFLCGGALINNRHVLTAAHCISKNLRFVRLGEYDISKTIDCIGNDCAPEPLEIEIEEKLVFASFDIDDESLYHDVALLRLKKEVNFNNFVKPICLPTTIGDLFSSHSNEKMVVAGWGATERATMSNIKLKVEIPIKKCKNDYMNRIFLDSAHICAGGEKNKDSCKGDSGGPLMGFKLDEDNEFQAYAFGVVSFGPRACGTGGVPGVYTNIAKYMYWIIDNLKA